MIRGYDFSGIVDERFLIVRQTLFDMMTNYNHINNGPAIERDSFTEVFFRLLMGMNIWTYNKHGSFTNAGADKAIEEEVNLKKTHQLGFAAHVVGRFERLEEGEVNFKRSWDTWLEDAVKEKSRTDFWRERYGMSYDDITVLKKGPPPTTAARPYVKWAMAGNSDDFADDVDTVIISRLQISGRRWTR